MKNITGTLNDREADVPEDAADVATYDAAMAEIAAGRDGPLPAEVSALLLRGAGLVAAIRKWRGMKQTELAERAQLSQGYLSDLQSGRRKGRRGRSKQSPKPSTSPRAG